MGDNDNMFLVLFAFGFFIVVDSSIAIKVLCEFKNLLNSQILILYDGQTINKVNDKITNFYFSKSDFNLNSLNTDVVIDDKIQETKTINHITCLTKYFNKDLKFESFETSATKLSWFKDFETFFNKFELISTNINFAPSSVNFLAIPFPKPDAEPVIIATLFFNLTIFNFLKNLLNLH